MNTNVLSFYALAARRVTPFSGRVSVTVLALSAVLAPYQARAADPAEAKTVGRIISQRPDLSSFLKVLEKAERGSVLAEKTSVNFTVFAPSNKAFEAPPEGAAETQLNPRNDDRLEEVFNYHVLGRAEPPFALEMYTTLQMTSGQWLSIDYDAGTIGGAAFTGEVIPCSNGVNASSLLSTVALSKDPFQEIADNAWDSRNAFRQALREMETRDDDVEDLLQIDGDVTSVFGR